MEGVGGRGGWVKGVDEGVGERVGAGVGGGGEWVGDVVDERMGEGWVRGSFRRCFIEYLGEWIIGGGLQGG